MVKKLSAGLLILLSWQVSFGKSVDESTAKKAGYQFLKSEGVAVNEGDLSLVYTATSQVGTAVVPDFYIYNTGAKGFVLVSADDNIIPVLGYSTESSFVPVHIPSQVSGWLNNYRKQIAYVIAQNLTTSAHAQDWKDLTGNGVVVRAGKLTAGGVVAPLLHTSWDQMPYYNALCPWDYSSDTLTITGCVATAMAQVMKYWNWPQKGVGSHSYLAPGYGIQAANFGGTTYKWDSMRNTITKVDSAIAVLMYHAGVSVDMNYGVTESGAYVNSDASPITNCAQYALTTYFSYKSTMQGLSHNMYTDTEWVHTLKAELDAHRPVLYTGDGPDGGHCFIADGYTTQNRFHINWGWSGNFNGFFIVEALSPGMSSFNDNQTLLIGIVPDSSILPHTDTTVITGLGQVGNSGKIAIYPNPATNEINIACGDLTIRTIEVADISGRMRKVVDPQPGSNSAVLDVSDLANGMYLVSVHADQGIITRKILIEK